MTPRRPSGSVPDSGRAGLFTALRDPVFARLFVAEAQSAIGDQLARVALAVLVFRATNSISATAAAYAATLLPAVIGGAVLGRLGDRWSRRAVMIGADVVRAVAYAAMSFTDLPLAVVIAFVVVAVSLGPVFSAAQVSALAERLGPGLFRSANGLRLAFSQITQVTGFVLGGVIVAWTGPHTALLLNAGSFVLSALLVATIRKASGAGRARSSEQELPAGNGLVELWRDRRLRRLVVLTMLVGLYVVPEGLAVPFGQAAGVTTAQIGVLFGAGAGGGALGAALLLRLRRDRAGERVCGWLAACCGIPLVATAFVPDWRVTAGLWLLSGIFTAYMVDATTLIVQAIPDERRAGLVGVLSAAVLASEGISLIAFGAVAQALSAGSAIAIAGGLGSIVALLTLLPSARAGERQPAGGQLGRHQQQRGSSHVGHGSHGASRTVVKIPPKVPNRDKATH